MIWTHEDDPDVSSDVDGKLLIRLYFYFLILQFIGEKYGCLLQFPFIFAITDNAQDVTNNSVGQIRRIFVVI